MSYYFTNDKNLKSEIKKTNVKINDLSFSFFTDNGVFSKKGLDFGTRSLLENIKIQKGDVLDLGCGYGPIGIYIAKKYNCNVDMIDINERAINLTKKNIKINDVKANVYISDSFSNVNKKYDYIITNPPIRVGKTILYDLLFTAKNYLKGEKAMYLVINKDQGAKTVIKDLEKEYKVKIIAKNKGFYVIEARID